MTSAARSSSSSASAVTASSNIDSAIRRIRSTALSMDSSEESSRFRTTTRSPVSSITSRPTSPWVAVRIARRWSLVIRPASSAITSNPLTYIVITARVSASPASPETSRAPSVRSCSPRGVNSRASSSG